MKKDFQDGFKLNSQVEVSLEHLGSVNMVCEAA